MLAGSGGEFISLLAAVKFEMGIEEYPCIIRDGDGLHLHRLCLIWSEHAPEQLPKTPWILLLIYEYSHTYIELLQINKDRYKIFSKIDP